MFFSGGTTTAWKRVYCQELLPLHYHAVMFQCRTGRFEISPPASLSSLLRSAAAACGWVHDRHTIVVDFLVLHNPASHFTTTVVRPIFTRFTS